MVQQQRICLQARKWGFNPWVRKIPWRRAWQPTPVFLPGDSLGERCLGATAHSVSGVRHDGSDFASTRSLNDAGLSKFLHTLPPQGQPSVSAGKFYLHRRCIKLWAFHFHVWLFADLPNPAIEPRSPALQADSLPSEPPGKPKNTGVGSLSLLQGIFPTHESTQGLPQADSLPAELSEKPHSISYLI